MFKGVSPVLVFEVIAVVLAALSAMITAAKKNLDFVGTYALAVVTAFGGGTIRDVLLDRRPFFWVSRWEYLIIIFALCIPFVYSKSVHDFSRRPAASSWMRSGSASSASSASPWRSTCACRRPWPS
jgi:uncharacterized membrane protein YeiH